MVRGHQDDVDGQEEVQLPLLVGVQSREHEPDHSHDPDQVYVREHGDELACDRGVGRFPDRRGEHLRFRVHLRKPIRAPVPVQERRQDRVPAQREGPDREDVRLVAKLRSEVQVHCNVLYQVHPRNCLHLDTNNGHSEKAKGYLEDHPI